jgi:Tfp pilus assembly protein FimT
LEENSELPTLFYNQRINMKSIFHDVGAGQKGLSFVGILAVMAILGLLAAISIPRLISLTEEGNVQSSVETGKNEAAAADKSAVQSAISLYLIDNGGTLAAQAAWIRLTAGAAEGPGHYLATSTAYWYKWDANGLNLQQSLTGT